MKTKRQLQEELRNVKTSNDISNIWSSVWDLEAKVDELTKKLNKLDKKVK